MIRKIICPTDFSMTANNAVAYASKLSKLTNSNLELYHLQPQRFLESVFAGTAAIEKTKHAETALNDVCKEVNKAFHISCSGHLETAQTFFESVITSEDSENNLLVMGTNGAEDVYQELFGTNTFNTLKKAQCPVLIIPENCSYATINKIVFAWDYSIASQNFYQRLKNIIELFNPEVTFLHISQHNTLISRDLFTAMKENMMELLKDSNVKLHFNQIFTDHVIQRVDQYMLESGANLLTLIFHDEKKGRIFAGNRLIKKISQIAEYPVLILHED